MFHVYLLQSESNPKRRYVGYTEQAPFDRLSDHNTGRVPSTARHRPWQLIAYVAVADKMTALDLERYFKSGSGHTFAQRHLWSNASHTSPSTREGIGPSWAPVAPG